MKRTEKNGTTILSDKGISVRIRSVAKSGKAYFIADYWVNGARKLVWRKTREEAERVAAEAIEKIQDGNTEVLDLSRTDRDLYVRTVAAKGDLLIPLDLLVSEAAAATRLLSGRATLIEVAKDWLQRHDVRVPSKTVTEACEDCLRMVETDGKSKKRQQQLSAVYDRFKADHHLLLTNLTTAHVSHWLAGLGFKERTRRNYRDAIGYLCRWCVLRGYLPRGTNWLEGVQNYSARKHGKIEIYASGEMAALLHHAESHATDMVAFLSIGAFAQLRHAEINRLEWPQIDLDDGFIEVLPIEGTKSDERRRLVPIKPNLKAWLLRYRKESGPVCPFLNTTKQLLKLSAAAGIKWKKNALRHSCISYRVAESGDVARVAEESGNSVAVIRTNYLRRVKPAEAEKWFKIAPN